MSRHRFLQNIDEDDDYSSSFETGSPYVYKFGSVDDRENYLLSASLENRFLINKNNDNHNSKNHMNEHEHISRKNEKNDIYTKKSPIMKKVSLDEEKKLLKECVEFLQSNGGDFVSIHQLEEISRRNNFDCEKSLNDFNSFMFFGDEGRKRKEIDDDDNDEKKSLSLKEVETEREEDMFVIEMDKKVIPIDKMEPPVVVGKKTKKKKKKKKKIKLDNWMLPGRKKTPVIPIANNKRKPVKKFFIDRPVNRFNVNIENNRNGNNMWKNTRYGNGNNEVQSDNHNDNNDNDKKDNKNKQSKKGGFFNGKKYKKPKIAKDLAKKRLNISIIGHVDAGKSTLMGNLLVQSGNIDQKLVHKYKKESQDIGKGSFFLAWVMDEEKEEREHGVTIDVGVKYFETENRFVTILDSPGHRDYIPNMIMGTSQSDIGVCVVDSLTGGFEKGFREGGQTREHLILAKCLGIKQLIIAVNKMDGVEYDKKRFNEIKSILSAYVKRLGFKRDRVFYIPVSGLEGENLVRKSEKIKWFDDLCLIERIDTLNPVKRNIEKPLRICVSDVYKTISTGTTIAGTIDSGTISKGEDILLMPMKEICKVKIILRNQNEVKTAFAGDNIEIGITGIKDEMLQAGQILCEPKFPILYSTKFESTIVTFNIKIPLIKGTQLIIHIQNIRISGIISSLISIVEKKKKKEMNLKKKKKPRLLKKHTTANVVIKTNDPIPVELYSNNKIYGRIILRKSGQTLASGIITKLIDVED